MCTCLCHKLRYQRAQAYVQKIEHVNNILCCLHHVWLLLIWL